MSTNIALCGVMWLATICIGFLAVYGVVGEFGGPQPPLPAQVGAFMALVLALILSIDVTRSIIRK